MSYDIQPPPSLENHSVPSKKFLKRQRYKQNKRNAKLSANQETIPPAVDLKYILRAKMNRLRSQRKGGAEPQVRQLSRDIRSGSLNLPELMERLGLTDPIVQQQAVESIQCSGMTDMRSIIQKIQSLVTERNDST